MALDSVSRKPEDLLKLADVHPELEAWVKANGPPPPSGTLTADNMPAIREMFIGFEQQYCEAIRPSDISDVLIENITVPARDGYPIPVKTYRPKNTSTPGPLSVQIHGGGFCIGSPMSQEPHCLMYVKEFGASCVNIDYRLAPEHKFPTAVNDCYDVLEWAAHHASELGADPTKGFIVEGASAGGSLTDILGHLARDNGLSPPVTGLAELFTSVLRPGVVPEKYKPEYLSESQDMPYGLSHEAIENFYMHYGGDPADHRQSSFNWPGKDGKSGHVGLPPVFFQIHGMDHLRDGALVYEKRLREEDGVKTKLKLYPGLPHGFTLTYNQFGIAKQHERDTVEGMRWLLSFSERK